MAATGCSTGAARRCPGSSRRSTSPAWPTARGTSSRWRSSRWAMVPKSSAFPSRCWPAGRAGGLRAHCRDPWRRGRGDPGAARSVAGHRSARPLGRMVIVPVANSPAFAAGRRTSPIDDLDLDRVSRPPRRLGHPAARPCPVPSRVRRRRSAADPRWYSRAWPRISSNARGRSPAAGPGSRSGARQQLRPGSRPTGRPGCSPRSPTMPEPAIEAEIGGLGGSLPEGRDRYCGHVRHCFAISA